MCSIFTEHQNFLSYNVTLWKSASLFILYSFVTQKCHFFLFLQKDTIILIKLTINFISLFIQITLYLLSPDYLIALEGLHRMMV